MFTRLLLAMAPCALSLRAGTEKDFEAALQAVDRTLGSGKAARAKEMLLAAIESSKEQPWALYHWNEIVDDLRRTTFWSTHTAPDPKTLVSGEVVSWSPTSRKLQLRYRPHPVAANASTAEHSAPAFLADFNQRESVLMHPLAFDGPFTIEVRGDAYPALSDPPRPPTVIVCADWTQATYVCFGLPERTEGEQIEWVPARILRVVDGEDQKLGETRCSQSAGKPFDLKVVVSASTVSGASLTTKLEGLPHGQFGFQDLPDGSEVVVTGVVEPSWFQSLVDAAVQEQWADFEKSYDPFDDLPEWLRDKARPESAAKSTRELLMPGNAAPNDTDLLRDFMTRMTDGGPTEALAYIDGLGPEEIRPELRDWLLVLVLRNLGRPRDALDAAKRLNEADPRFFEARSLRVQFEAELGGARAAIADCQQVVADFPATAEAYVQLCSLHLEDDHVDLARAQIRAAIDAGVAAHDLEEIGYLVARAVRGPLWPRAYEYKSQHYVVSSDISEAICTEASRLLERAYEQFNVHLRRVGPASNQRFHVHLFSGHAGYDAYARNLFGADPNTSAGLYSPVIKQLLIWNQADSAQTMRTVRHEGFHQYLDRLLSGSAPVWFNEGLAEYYEGSRVLNGKWREGEMRREHVDTLHESGSMPLEQFVRLRSNEFYRKEEMERCYAQAWAFIHFLLQSGPEHKRLFDRLFNALIAGTPPDEAMAKVFDEASLAKLEPEFAQYVATLE